ncbi:secreted protein [gut metagenome]|uniref:Secreted protein n=1 Tax=gut metagenome TaxID=749906 RepID=J9G120_9ZZZZ
MQISLNSLRFPIFRFPAPCACAAAGVILAEQLRQIGCLRFVQLLMRSFSQSSSAAISFSACRSRHWSP